MLTLHWPDGRTETATLNISSTQDLRDIFADQRPTQITAPGTLSAHLTGPAELHLHTGEHVLYLRQINPGNLAELLRDRPGRHGALLIRLPGPALPHPKCGHFSGRYLNADALLIRPPRLLDPRTAERRAQAQADWDAEVGSSGDYRAAYPERGALDWLTDTLLSDQGYTWESVEHDPLPRREHLLRLAYTFSDTRFPGLRHPGPGYEHLEDALDLPPELASAHVTLEALTRHDPDDAWRRSAL